MPDITAKIVVTVAIAACLTIAADAAESPIKPGDEVVVQRATVLKVGAESVATVRAGQRLISQFSGCLRLVCD